MLLCVQRTYVLSSDGLHAGDKHHQHEAEVNPGLGEGHCPTKIKRVPTTQAAGNSWPSAPAVTRRGRRLIGPFSANEFFFRTLNRKLKSACFFTVFEITCGAGHVCHTWTDFKAPSTPSSTIATSPFKHCCDLALQTPTQWPRPQRPSWHILKPWMCYCKQETAAEVAQFELAWKWV